MIPLTQPSRRRLRLRPSHNAQIPLGRRQSRRRRPQHLLPGETLSPSSASSASLAPLTANVTSASDWARLVSTAESKFGGLDIVINNAGTSYRNKPTLEVTEEEFERVFSVNVKSVYLSVPACVPALKRRGGGSVVNVASVGVMRPRPGLVWYNASKAAVANVSSFLLSLALG